MKMQKNETIRKSFIKFGFGITALLLFVNCNNNDDDSSGTSCAEGGWITEWTEAQEALSLAAQAYSNDRTVETCTNYKNAVLNYLDSYDDFRICLPAATRAELDESIKESREEAAEIDCSEG